jgi:hypothetical protein
VVAAKPQQVGIESRNSVIAHFPGWVCALYAELLFWQLRRGIRRCKLHSGKLRFWPVVVVLIQVHLLTNTSNFVTYNVSGNAV